MFVKYYKPFKILYNTGTERQILIKKNNKNPSWRNTKSVKIV